MPENHEPPASEQRESMPMKIQPAQGSASLPRATTAEAEAAYQRPYANAQLNSRLTQALPEGLWEARWRVAVDPFFPYLFVLQVGNRIMLQGRDRWQLFDHQGTSLALDNFGDSDIVLDEEHGLMYMVDRVGRGLALHLEDAKPAYILPIEGTQDDRRTFLARQGNFMVITSSRRPTNPHDPDPLVFSVAEVYHLGDSLYVSEGFLLSANRTGMLSYYVERMLAALYQETLVIAMRDRILRTDLNLNIQQELEDTFTPLAMSLDETGRAHLIVRTETEAGAERHALWILTPQGERLADVDIPAHPTGAYTPPIVGYDHRVYVLSGDRVLAIAPEGDVLWDKPAGGSIAGAVVTADDQLLVAAAGVLLVFDAEGERDSLFYLEDDRWTTPPVLTDRQRLLVASERHLYSLQLKQ